MKERIITYKINIFGRCFSAKKALDHPFLSGSLVMIVGLNFINFVAYFYHLVIGRLLGPASYGELASILSIMGIITSIYTFIGLVIVKLVSTSDKKRIASISSWFHGNSLRVGLILFAIFLPLSSYIGSYLHMSKWVIVVIPFSSLLYLISFVYRSVLQGVMEFKAVVIPGVVDISIRLVLGALFVFVGLGVFGGVVAIALGALVGYLLFRKYIAKFVGFTKEIPLKNISPNITRNSFPILISSLATFSLFNIDLLLAKHYLDPLAAGIYASISTLGKVVYYGTSPVNAVMFPYISKRYSKGDGYTKILYFSLLATVLICSGVLMIYRLVPRIMVNILFGSSFIEAANYLFLFAVFVSFLSLSSLLVNYFISKEKYLSSILISLAAITQILGILMYHEGIREIIYVSLYSSGLLTFCLLLLLIVDQRGMLGRLCASLALKAD